MNDCFIRHLTICSILMCCSCSQLSKESEASVLVYTSSSSDQKIEELATAIRGAFFPETKATSYDVQEISYLLSGTDTLAISVDFSNDNGFVVISQTDLTPLCVMTGGSLNYALENIPAFRLSFDTLLEELSIPTPGPIDPIDTTFTSIVPLLINQFISASVSPLIEVNMHQGYPFNMFTPNGLAGCTPIAIAQAFSVYDYPDSIDVTFSESAISNLYLSWNDMKQHLSYHNNSACDYCIQNGYLLREIGNRCQASYNQGVTGAWPTPECIGSFGFSSITLMGYDLNRLLSSLDAGYPTIICGFDSSQIFGHSWNIDGYYIQESTYDVVTLRGNEVIESNWIENIKDWYLHFNYGWGGAANGYFLSRRERTKHFPGEEEGSYSVPISLFDTYYNTINRIVTHIKPN